MCSLRCSSQKPWLCGSSRETPELTTLHGCHFLPAAPRRVGIHTLPKQPLPWNTVVQTLQSPHWGSRFPGPSGSQWSSSSLRRAGSARSPCCAQAAQRLYGLMPPLFPTCLAGNRRGRAMLIQGKAEMLASSLLLWSPRGATAFSRKSYSGTLPV